MAAAAADDRIGFAEEFNSLDGWSMESDRPLRDMKVFDGRAVLSTYAGSISDTKPPDQPRSLEATCSIIKQYQQEVDLDKHHYLVMKTDEKSGYSILYLNKKEVQVSYSSGLIAQDLRQGIQRLPI